MRSFKEGANARVLPREMVAKADCNRPQGCDDPRPARTCCEGVHRRIVRLDRGQDFLILPAIQAFLPNWLIAAVRGL